MSASGLVIAWLMCLGASIAGAAGASDSGAGDPDHHFYQRAAEGGIAEVEAGKLAQLKGATPEVRDFGAMMVEDHTKANNRLAKLAADKGVALPDDVTLMQKAVKSKLALESNDNFDEEYIKHQIKAHEDTIALLKKELSAGDDMDAQRFAGEMLPTVEAHLAAITKLAAERGINH
jgi:putative membrane protein